MRQHKRQLLSQRLLQPLPSTHTLNNDPSNTPSRPQLNLCKP